MDKVELQMLHIASEAHLAAERRLDAAYLVMAADEQTLDEDIPEEVIEAAAAQLAGPFCGCQTCIIREVLSAAMPHLRHLIALESCLN